MLARLTVVLVALCALASVTFAQPTYSDNVAAIYQAKCQICHRDGDVAPFSLNNYDDAVTWAFDSARSINEGKMPPWKPVAGYGDF
ncbi:MAG TPA: cytochrome c, partial [Bryobacteraceae bacterium]|nr:cytochrome c [Bryobacteraceae bacterium]